VHWAFTGVGAAAAAGDAPSRSSASRTLAPRDDARHAHVADGPERCVGELAGAATVAIRLIESGRLPLARLHTHDFGLDEAEREIQTLAGEVPGELSIHSCLLPALG
jgi:hypothetical protein